MSELAQQLIAENIAKWEWGEDARVLLKLLELTRLEIINHLQWM